MSEELVDFGNLITLKNQLCALDRKQLMQMYQDKGSYLTFLNAVVSLIENDIGFLLFSDEFLEKILLISQIYRFEFKEHEVRDCINDIITYVNGIKALSDESKKTLMNGYLAYQEDMREASFHTTNAFLSSLAYDAVVFAALRDGEIDKIKDEEYFLMSLNYLMKACPEFFQDPRVKKDAMTLLDQAGSHRSFLGVRKKFVKGMKENLESITKKEE